jgi:NADH:ubiquinone oxidoreductase subunit 6 (subunit J)
MNSLVLPCRYALFAAFVICHAITCSVAVWNLSLAQTVGQNMGVDVFIISVGAIALLFIFSIIILELTLKNTIVGRVWFESAWVGFFFLLEFCASVSLAAIGPGIMCTARMMEFNTGSCNSTRVLLVFDWICTLLLLGYLILLTASAHMNQKENPRVWQCSVQEVFSVDTPIYRAGLVSPTLPSFVKKMAPSIVAPQPRHPPTQAINAHISGLSPDYAIEHFRFPTERPIPPVPAAPPPQHQVQNTREATATLFYPQQVQQTIRSQPLTTPVTVPTTKQTRAPADSPPPLGNWPRADVISQPARSKREAPRRFILTPTVALHTSPNPKIPPKSAPLTRPTGPRSGRGPRPPPLDLSGISAHRRSSG